MGAFECSNRSRLYSRANAESTTSAGIRIWSMTTPSAAPQASTTFAAPTSSRTRPTGPSCSTPDPR